MDVIMYNLLSNSDVLQHESLWSSLPFTGWISTACVKSPLLTLVFMEDLELINNFILFYFINRVNFNLISRHFQLYRINLKYDSQIFTFDFNMGFWGFG